MQPEKTSTSAKVITDSVHDGSRLTTIEATFPRFLLAELNTHRVLSRNSASSRAIPVWKRLIDVVQYPFVPLQFGKNKAGMQSAEGISDIDTMIAKQNWLVGRDISVIQAFMLAGSDDQILKDSKGNPKAFELCGLVHDLMRVYPDVTKRLGQLTVGVHKQHANRVLEPYAWHTVIMTATQWRNFYALRASTMAQPEIQDLAILMARVHMQSVPKELGRGEWHLPYITNEDIEEMSDPISLARISTGRCSRVSFLTHDGKRILAADLDQADSLQGSGHTSPFEHPAKAVEKNESKLGGNFSGSWAQYRKMLAGEHDFSNLICFEDLLKGMKEDQKLTDFVLNLPK